MIQLSYSLDVYFFNVFADNENKLELSKVEMR